MTEDRPEAGHGKPSKARIRLSFERAAPGYDSAAAVQRQICAELAGGLPAMAVHRLLDAGCGTGHAQAALQARYPDAQAIALDLSPAMLGQVGAPCCRLGGDLEHLPLADASLDLYWSSLAVQWCDLAAALGEARRTLRPGGWLALASLGPATFGELRHAFAGVDRYRHTLGFHGVDDVRRIAIAAGLTVRHIESRLITAHYADFKTLLRAVKAIGANQLGEGRRSGLMSRGVFLRAEAAIETLRGRQGLPLTYDVIILHATP